MRMTRGCAVPRNPYGCRWLGVFGHGVVDAVTEQSQGRRSSQLRPQENLNERRWEGMRWGGARCDTERKLIEFLDEEAMIVISRVLVFSVANKMGSRYLAIWCSCLMRCG